MDTSSRISTKKSPRSGCEADTAPLTDLFASNETDAPPSSGTSTNSDANTNANTSIPELAAAIAVSQQKLKTVSAELQRYMTEEAELTAQIAVLENDFALNCERMEQLPEPERAPLQKRNRAIEAEKKILVAKKLEDTRGDLPRIPIELLNIQLRLQRQKAAAVKLGEQPGELERVRGEIVSLNGRCATAFRDHLLAKAEAEELLDKKPIPEPDLQAARDREARLSARSTKLDAELDTLKAQSYALVGMSTGDVKELERQALAALEEAWNLGAEARRIEKLVGMPCEKGDAYRVIISVLPERLREFIDRLKAECRRLRDISGKMGGEPLPGDGSGSSDTDAAVARSERYQSYRRGEYRDRKLAPLLVDKMYLPSVGLGKLVGGTQAFKSFTMLELCLSVATGRRAFGTMPPNLTGITIYVAGEGARGIEDQRVLAYEIDARKADPNFDLDKFPFYTIRELPPAAIKEERKAFLASIDATVEKSGQPLRLVVLDTLNKMMPGLDENSAGIMAGVHAVAEQIYKKHGCMVVIVHHTGKNKADKSGRGSSAGPGADDWTAYAEATKDKERGLALVEVEIMKDRDGPGEGEHIYFQAHKIDLQRPDWARRNHCLVLKEITKTQHEAVVAPSRWKQAQADGKLQLTSAMLREALNRLDAFQTRGRSATRQELVDTLLRMIEEASPFPTGTAGDEEREKARDRFRQTLRRGCGHGSEKFMTFVVPKSGPQPVDMRFWLPSANGADEFPDDAPTVH